MESKKITRVVDYKVNMSDIEHVIKRPDLYAGSKDLTTKTYVKIDKNENFFNQGFIPDM